MSDRVDRILFLVIVGVAWVWIIARAMLVPLVHDECASLLWFVRSGSWLPYRSHWDANNHYLSSGIAVLLTRMVGEAMVVLRSGSLLAFVPYAWATWRIGHAVHDGFVRACVRAALLLCPFALDFFSLFRGYAMAQAGWLVVLDGLLRFATTRSSRHLVVTLVAMLLASAAIIALVPVWTIVVLILAVVILRPRDDAERAARLKHSGLLAVLGIAPLVGAAVVAMELKKLGLLYHGSTEGFFSVTVMSLCRYVLGGPVLLTSAAVVFVAAWSSSVALRDVSRTSVTGSPLVIIVIVLWSDVVARLFMAYGLGINFPEDRAALHMLPLVLMSIALAIDRIVRDRACWRWAAAVLLALPIRTALTANLDHTLLWPEQSIPTRFMERVAALQRSSERPLVVGAHHQLTLAWPMNAWSHGLDVPSLQVEGFPGGEHDLRISDIRTIEAASIGYHAVDSAQGPGLWLLERDVPMDAAPIPPFLVPPREGDGEFLELVHLPDTLLRSPVELTVDMPLSLGRPSPDVRLVVEVNDTQGRKLFYDALAPLALRPVWSGDRLVMARTLPASPTADRAVIYVHDPDRTPVSVGEASITIRAIRR